jgi:aspartate/methionine/tyrosine aminotransferase
VTARRLAHIPGIGVNVMGDRADAAADPTMLRMENLDTDLRPPTVALEHGAWILYDAALERIRFDDRPPVHPASHPELAERVITVGSASKELRMIGWRVGWVAATPMGGWGPSGDRYLRLVFANEPVERLHDLRERFAAAL